MLISQSEDNNIIIQKCKKFIEFCNSFFYYLITIFQNGPKYRCIVKETYYNGLKEDTES